MVVGWTRHARLRRAAAPRRPHRRDQPLIGRWTQQDPLDRVGNLREGNRYVYVGGDPVNNADPSGQHLVPCITAPCPWADDINEAVFRRVTACRTAAAVSIDADLIYSKASRQRWYKPRRRGAWIGAIGCTFGLLGIG